jgi:anti-sigma regulatory factor (Ser/Thr protein kinase)
MSGPYSTDQIERALSDLGPILDPSAVGDQEHLLIDLRGLVYIAPSPLSLLAAVLKAREEDGCPCTVLPPKSPLTRHYLQRMDFTKLLFKTEIHEPFQRKKPFGFRPVQHFCGDDDYWLAAKELTEALAERCQPDEVAKAAIRICLDEMAENVVQHAYTERGGFAAAQTSLKRKTLEIAIVDLGVGIRESLARNPMYAGIESDVEAITKALEPRVSSTPERNAGIGLYITNLLLHANNGQLLVRSGTGAILRGAVDADEQRELSFPGTIVAIKAHTDAPLDMNHVYRYLLEHHPSPDDDQVA